MLVARRALRPWPRLASAAPASRAVTRHNAYAFDAALRTLQARAVARRGVASKATLPNVLAGVAPPPVVVETLTSRGLRLADGTVVPGACIFVEGEVLLWDVPALAEDGWLGLSNEDIRARFEVFEVVTPRPDILLIGTGGRLEMLPPVVRQYLNGLGIQVDVMDTWNACSTYNILAEEGRRVAAALLPHTPHAWKP